MLYALVITLMLNGQPQVWTVDYGLSQDVCTNEQQSEKMATIAEQMGGTAKDLSCVWQQTDIRPGVMPPMA